MSEEQKNIQMTPAICTQCGASVEVDPKQEAAVCKYCGTPFIIEKAINKYNIQNAEGKHVDPINFVKTGVVESVLNFADKQITMRAEKKKRIEEENKLQREKSLALIKKYWWVYAALMGALVLILAIGAVNESKDSAGKISVNISSSELVGENYEDVVSNLENAGFTNIETEVLDDLVTGWLTKDGEVEKVEIDGTTPFSSDSKFEPNAKIVVTYHTFPEEDSKPEESVQSSESVIESPGDNSNESGIIYIDPEDPKYNTILTADNNEDLSAVLLTKDTSDPIIKDFADKYSLYTIEFDGYIAYVSQYEDSKTRLDVLIYVGDYRTKNLCGPSIQLENIGTIDYNWMKTSINQNVHVVAEVIEYREASGLLILKPISVEER